MNTVVNNGRSIRKLVDLGTEKGDIGIVRVRAKEFTSSEVEFTMLEMYYTLVVKSTYLQEEAYEFLVKGKTYKQIIEKTNVNSNYLRNIIYHETRRLFRELKHDPLALVISKQCTDDKCEAIMSRISEMMEKESIRVVTDIEDLFTFDIGAKAVVDREFNRNVDEQDFKELVDVMKYFVKPYQEIILEQLDEKYIGYILHLLKTDASSLVAEDQERKKYIQMGWMLK